MVRAQFNLSEEQRNRLKFFRIDFKFTPQQIRDRILKPNGQKYQLKVSFFNKAFFFLIFKIIIFKKR